MNTHCTRGLSILGLLLAMTARTQANDIVDFLRAVNGIQEQRHPPASYQSVGHHNDDPNSYNGIGYSDRVLSGRDLHKQSMQRADGHLPFGQYGNNVGYDRFDPGQFGPDRLGRNQSEPYGRVDLRHQSYDRPGYDRSGAGISFRVSSNGGMSPGYSDPLYIPSQQPQVLPPVQRYLPAQMLPHQIGEIVDCRVPLATGVRIEDECNIAPDAVPVVVAIRDPNMRAHECHERLVYVQVFVPPCPLRGLTISPCTTRVGMDFGQYEVDIKSKDGIIVIDYDN